MKGVSPLLAAVLLIAVTVAISTLVMGWVSTTVRTTQTSVTNKTVAAVECAAAGISIDNVYVRASVGTDTLSTQDNGSVVAVVRNSGQTDGLQLVSAQAYNISGGNFSMLPIAGGAFSAITLNRGTVVVVNATARAVGGAGSGWKGGSCPGDFSRVIVTTNCGGVSAEYTRTPRCF